MKKKNNPTSHAKNNYADQGSKNIVKKISPSQQGAIVKWADGLSLKKI